MPLLLQKDGYQRSATVHHSIDGNFALREGNWKLALCPGSGGWSTPRNKAAREQHLPEIQLFDLQADPGEKNNVQAAHPEVVKKLLATLEALVANGRSTTGPALKNDVTVDLYKKE